MTTTTVTTQKLTYEQIRLNAVSEHFPNTDTITKLGDRVATPFKDVPQQVQTWIREGKVAELKDWLNNNYQEHDAIIKELVVAQHAIKHFTDALLLCTPGKVEFSAAQIDHMVGLGYNMEEHRQKEAAHSQSCGALQTIINELNALVVKTNTYMADTQIAINTAAYDLKRLENQTGIMDRLPSRGYYYYAVGLKAYQDSLNKPGLAATTTSSTATEVDGTAPTVAAAAVSAPAKPAEVAPPKEGTAPKDIL